MLFRSLVPDGEPKELLAQDEKAAILGVHGEEEEGPGAEPLDGRGVRRLEAL